MKLTFVTKNLKPIRPIKTALDDYQKRLSKFCKTNIVSKPTNGYRVLISQTGRELTSPELATYIEKLQVNGVSHIEVTWDDLAYDDSIQIVSCHLSESMLTLLTLEQFYRAFKILNHEPYHK